MSPTGNRRRLSRIALAAAIVGAIVTGVVTTAVVPRYDSTTTTPDASVPDAAVPDASVPDAQVALSLSVSRDIGRLPALGTSAGQFCGSVGALGAPEHCYGLQEASGDSADSVGGLTLVAGGTPRYQVATGIPVENAGSASFSSEYGIEMDDSGSFVAAADTVASSATITIVYRLVSNAVAHYLYDWGYSGGHGFQIRVLATNVLKFDSNFGTNLVMTPTNISPDNAWHCLTVAYDGASSVAWQDGVAVTWTTGWSSYGTTTGAAAVGIGALANRSNPINGGIARFRVDHAVASLSDHQALCGTFGQPLVASHAAKADSTWSRSGGGQCYRTGAASATCFPGGAMGYRWNGTAYRWATDADSRTNRILYSASPSCALGWTCATATIAAAAAPDGSRTAGAITMSGGTVDVAGTGYTGNAPVYPSIWAKCSSGTLTIAHQGGTGSWTVDCSTIGGAWEYLTASHSAVTVGAGWTATAGGAVTMRLSGADATVWIPQATEVQGYGSILTWAAARSTGDAAWTLANATGTYWAAGDTVTDDWTLTSGTCWVTGATLRLTGAAGSECIGDFSSIEVTR